MKLNIAVVDDREEDRVLLEHGIRSFFSRRPKAQGILRTFSGGMELLQAFAPDDLFQLVFLDIMMDEMDGIELARRIRRMNTGVLLVFTTTSQEYVFDAFPLHPFDYLVKPYGQETLDGVLQEALRVLSIREPEIVVRASRTEVRVAVERIVAAVSQGHTVELALSDGSLLRCNVTFSEIQRKLAEESRFLMCNRGILVNMDHVLSIDGELIHMVGGKSYGMRTKGRREMLSRFSQYQLSRMRRGGR